MSRALSRNRESGFTLVELLVVIIIIGILAAIAIPVFLNQRKRAADATVQSDLKSAAIAVTDSDITAQEFYALFNKSGVNAWAEPSDWWNMPTATDWNSAVPDVSPINVSPGVLLAIYMYRADTTTWNQHHEGDFCISGVHVNSNYDYAPGSGNTSDYDKYLFYDVQQGGVKKMDELVEAYRDDPRSVSCSGPVNSYMTAHGLH